MNELLERGLKGALSALVEALDTSTDRRPQQFDPGERRARRRSRSRQTEEQLEAETVPEHDRSRRSEADIQVEPASSSPSPQAIELRQQLRDRHSVQHAFLLMELLDKPRALRPYQPS